MHTVGRGVRGDIGTSLVNFQKNAEKPTKIHSPLNFVQKTRTPSGFMAKN
jgi:hypothetical protein